MEKLRNKNIIYQELKAKNTRSGNPNRIFHIYDSKVNFIGWIDREYAGKAFTKRRKCAELETIEVSSTRAYKRGKEFENKGL